MKDLAVYALAAAVLVTGVLGFSKDPVQVSVVSEEGQTRVVETVGAFPGPDVYSYMNVHGAFEQGGGSNTVTPTSNAVTLTRAQMADSNVITFTASTTMPALTATLPASTTFPLSNEAGSYRTWVVENPFTAAATTTTLAAGTGIDLQEPDGQNVVIGINNFAFLSCLRTASTDIVCRVDETIPAD